MKKVKKSLSAEEYFSYRPTLWRQAMASYEFFVNEIPLSDGLHEVKIVHGMFTNPPRGRPTSIFVFATIPDGVNEVKKFNKRYPLDDQSNVTALIFDINKLGGNIKHPRQLRDVYERILYASPRVEIEVSTRGEERFIKIVRAIDKIKPLSEPLISPLDPIVPERIPVIEYDSKKPMEKPKIVDMILPPDMNDAAEEEALIGPGDYVRFESAIHGEVTGEILEVNEEQNTILVKLNDGTAEIVHGSKILSVTQNS